MLADLSGDDGSSKRIGAAIGKRIAAISLDNNELRIHADGADPFALYDDDGQSCCESRYMSCDDDLNYHVGAELRSIEIADAPAIEAGDESHEVQFLRIITDRGTITVSNHNEHNGYYGGFAIRAREWKS